MIGRKNKLLCVILGLLLLLTMSGSGFAATVYVGNVGFDTDQLDNNATYLNAFQTYLANHANDPLIVNANGIVFDANAFSNAPAGTDPVTFANSNPVSNPPTGTPWDGTGIPGELTVISISSITATNGTITPTFSAAPPAGLVLADFNVTATLDGAAYTLQNLAFSNNAFTFTAVPGKSAAQSLVITVAATTASTKISGTANATVSIPASVFVVNSVSAINGTVTVTLSGTPTTDPAIADFEVTQAIGGAAATTVTPTAIAANGKVVTLTVPQVAAGDADKSVVMIVSYKGGTAVSASAFTVAKATLSVSSVSAINATTIEASMADGTNATRAADKAEYTVTVGNVAVAVSAVSYDGATKKATLTVDLNGKEGTVKVNGTAATAAVDYKAPVLSSAAATNSTTVELTFDEALSSTGVATLTNYSITPSLTVSSAALKTGDSKVVVLTLSNETFSLTNYTVTVSGLKDAAGNVMTQTSKTFQGVSTPNIQIETAVIDANGNDAVEGDEDVIYSTTATKATTDRSHNILIRLNQNVVASSLSVDTVKLYDVTNSNYVAIAAPTANIQNIIINPVADLSNSTTYRIELSGVKVSNSFGSEFTVPDKTITFIVGTGATLTRNDNLTIAVTAKDASGNDLIYVTSDQKLDASTANSNTVKLYQVSNPDANKTYSYDLTDKRVEDNLNAAATTTLVSGTVNYDDTRRKITFVPSANLPSNGQFVFVVEGVKNLIGITTNTAPDSFATADTAAPVVQNVVSKNSVTNTNVNVLTATTDISIDADLSVEIDFYVNFDKAIADPTAAPAATADVYDMTTSTYLSAPTLGRTNRTSVTGDQVSATINNARLTIQMAANLTNGHQYKITINGLTSDNENKTPVGKVEFTFTTDYARPTITGFYQDQRNDDNDIGVQADWTKLSDNVTSIRKIGADADGKLIILFNKAIDPATITAIKVFDATDNNKDVTSGMTIAAGGGNTYVTIDDNDADLKADNTYRIEVGTGLTDTLGNALAVKQTLTLTTNDADLTVNTANSRIYDTAQPVNGEDLSARRTGVKVDKSIKLEFSDKVLASSVTSANIVLKETVAGTVVSATLTVDPADPNGQTVIVAPASNLKSLTSYTLSVGTGLKDDAGNPFQTAWDYEFMTEATGNPQVTNTTPANNGTGVSVTPTIVLTFDRAMNTSGANSVLGLSDTANNANTSQNIWLIPEGGSAYALATNASALWNAATKQVTITLNPGQSLNYNTKYTLTLDTDIQDSNGLALASDYSLSFTSVADTTAPSIKEVKQNITNKVMSTSSVVTGVANNQNIVITFNDKDLTGNATVTIFNETDQTYATNFGLGTTVGVSEGNPNEDFVTVDLAANNLSADKTYRLTISGVKDLRNNVMTAAVYRFITGPAPTLTVDTDGPAGGLPTTYADAADGANTVLVTGKVRVEPNEEIDTTTVTADTANIQDPIGNKVGAAIAFDGAFHNFTITPNANLAKGTTYHVYLTNGIKDIAGNSATAVDYTFSTVLDASLINFVDFRDSLLTSIGQNSVVQEVYTDNLYLSFDKNLKTSTVNSTNVKLHDDSDNKYVTLLDGNFTVVDGNRIRVTPLTILTAGHVYTITVSGITGTGTPAETLASTVSRTFAVRK